MKHLYSQLLLATCLFCAACTQDPAGADTPNSPEKDGHRISIESALAELDTALAGIDGQTRTGGTRTVSSVAVVKGTDIVSATRSNEIPDLENVVYIANFENNQGYAILAADNRLESVIAITEQGSLTPEEFTAVAQNNDCEISKAPPVLPEVAAYAARIGSGGIDGPVILPPVPTNYITYGAWTYNAQKGPYIQIKWGQNPPYNYYSPEISGLESYMKGKGYVGCVAVAIGQLVAMNSYRGLFPFPNSLGNYAIDKNNVWRSIDILKNRLRGSKMFSSNDESAECRAVAYFLRAIGNAVKMDYRIDGSGATINNAATLLSTIGYRNVSIAAYSENQVCQMIDNLCPVYIRGEGYDGKEREYLSHAWIIDGVYRQQRRVESRSIQTGALLSAKWEYRNLFHCNFGYAGDYDGYYVPAIYDFQAGSEFVDPTIDNDKQVINYVYGYYREFKIITHAYSL